MSSSRKLFPSLRKYDLVLSQLITSRDTLKDNVELLDPTDQTCINVKLQLIVINSDIAKMKAHLESTFAIFKKDRMNKIASKADEKTKAQLQIVENRTKEIIEEKKREEIAAKERKRWLVELEKKMMDLNDNLKSAHNRTLSVATVATSVAESSLSSLIFRPATPSSDNHGTSSPHANSPYPAMSDTGGGGVPPAVSYGNGISFPILSEEELQGLSELKDEVGTDEDTTRIFRPTEDVYFSPDIEWNHTRLDTPEPEHNPLPLPPPPRAAPARRNLHATSHSTQGKKQSVHPQVVEGSSRGARAEGNSLSFNALSLEDHDTHNSDSAEENSVGHGSQTSKFSIDTEAFGNHR